MASGTGIGDVEHTAMNTRQHWIDPAMATIAAAVLAGLMGLVCGPARAEIAQYPLSVTQAIPPQVILALSKDEQLFKAAYDDITDIDDDGFLEATYDNSFDYYGYFDPNACYSYSGNGYFAPATEASSHQCTGLWSGNFLNWATMTRMDLLRRVLYGGYRSVDTTSHTILERALITRDSHAFAKVFAPDGGATDVAHYTPFAVTAVTLCNVTEAPSGRSQELNTATYPPLIKVAAGNWRLWAIGDPFDKNLPCAWEANSAEQNTAPHNSAGEALGTFKARVKVCGENLPEANCKQNPQQGSARKPTGILQKFGDEQGVRFGMVSGSYQKNVSGGVLRRKSGYTAGNDLANVAQDEVDLQNGIFTGNSGIIKTIDSFTLNGFDFATNTYTDNCLAPNSSDLSDGSCTNWGNPIAEIVLESLRYLAGAEHPSDEYDADDSGVNAALAPIQDWGDPISVDSTVSLKRTPWVPQRGSAATMYWAVMRWSRMEIAMHEKSTRSPRLKVFVLPEGR
jgi:type IV pilus assembly protein PilY1